MSSTSYMHTGNNISVPEDELIAYVHFSLSRYEELVNASGEEPSYNPYTQPIVYTMEDGRQVQVPEEIHQKALQMWAMQKQAHAQEQNQTQNQGHGDLPCLHPTQAYEAVDNNYQMANQNYSQDLSELQEAPAGYQQQVPDKKEVRFSQNVEEIPPQDQEQQGNGQIQPVFIVQKDNNMMWMVLLFVGMAVAYYMYKKQQTRVNMF